MKPIPVLLIISFASCSVKTYRSHDLQTAIAHHRTIAVLPAYVTFKLHRNEGEKIPAGSRYDLEQTIGYEIQHDMYDILSAAKQNYSVTFQSIDSTNAKLRAEHISYMTAQYTDRKELCRILGVDALIDARLLTGKPISDARQMSTMAYTGFSQNMKETTLEITIYDGATGKALWKLSNKVDDNRDGESQHLFEKTLRKAVQQFPYKR